MTRQIIFTILALLSSLLVFYFFRNNLAFSERAIFIVVWLVVFAICFGLAAFFVKERLIFIILSILMALTFLFVFGFGVFYLIGAVIISVAAFLSWYNVQKEKMLRIKILPEKIIHEGLTPIFFALSIALAVVAYFSPHIQNIKEQFALPSWAEEQVIRIALPDFNQNLTVDEMINIFTKQNPKTSLSSENRTKILKEMGLADLKLKGTDKVSDNPQILHQLVSKPIYDILEKFSEYLPLILALIVWQLLLALEKIIIPVAVFIDFLIYLLMLKLDLVKIKKIAVEKEVLD